MALEDLTGQAEALSVLTDWADKGPDGEHMVLTGPRGSGKSWLVEQFVRSQERAHGLSIILAPGQRNNHSRPLLPIRLAFNANVDFSEFAKQVVAESGQSAGGEYGGILKIALDFTLNYQRRKQEIQTKYISSDDRTALIDLEKMARNKRSILILEDLQCWDEESLKLLAVMTTDPVKTAFPFINSLRFLGVISSGEEGACPESFETARRILAGHAISLHYVDESGFGEALRVFGAGGGLSADLVSGLHQASRGHLWLTRHLAQQLQGSGASHATAGKDPYSICRDILRRRLGEMGPSGQRIAEALRLLSAIGVEAPKAEAECLTRGSEHGKALKEAVRCELLVERRDNYRFPHDIVHCYFSDELLSDGDLDVLTHGQFAECLRKIRPGDYLRRSRHHARAGQRRLAETCMAQHILALSRTASAFPMEETWDIAANSQFRRFLRAMRKISACFDAGDYSDAIIEAKSIEESLPQQLLAERDCVVARCHIKLLTGADRLYAATLMDQWDCIESSEPELWARVVLTRIIAKSFAYDTQGAIRETRRFAMLDDFRYRDPDILRTIMNLSLKADMLYGPEAACAQLQEAVEYFGPAAPGMGARDPARYFVGLTNLAANAIMRGAYSEAKATAARAIEYLDEFRVREPCARIPRTDIVVNNFLVAAFRDGKLAASECSGYLRKILDLGIRSNDHSLFISNNAAFLALSGKADEAVAILSDAFAEISGRGDADPYYVYFIGNNLAGALFTAGRAVESASIWDKITPLASKINLVQEGVFTKRHVMLGTIYSDTGSNLNRWDEFIATRHPAMIRGPIWLQLRRGFLLSDLQFWSED